MSDAARSFFIAVTGGLVVLATHWPWLAGMAAITALYALAPWKGNE